MKLVAIASPNFNRRPADTAVDTIVLHSDASDDAQKSISWIRSKESKVSYHCLVDRDGTVYRFVEAIARAWHAGVSIYDGRSDCNNFSLGLSFANRNDGKEPFTEEQLVAGAAIVVGWMELFPKITLDRITTHAVIREAWRATHPDAEVKTDPGPLFPLARFCELVRVTKRGAEA